MYAETELVSSYRRKLCGVKSYPLSTVKHKNLTSHHGVVLYLERWVSKKG